jgi:A/G-specific adenine glycosylase
MQPLARRLLAWYGKNRRDLPWRRTRDPYRVWVSEVLLQQTRVPQAAPYYERFLARFPTLRSLADAPLDDVLKAWEGLGYYARARNLHAAAKEMVEAHGGRIPSDEKTLAGLPGFGPYTTNAVLSIAYGQDRAVADGNVERVLSRVLKLEKDDRAEVQARAQGMLPRGRAGDFNQALMDLGSTVCTPRAPKCGECPLAGLCRAHAEGREEDYPRKARRGARPVRRAVALLAREGERVLLVKRPDRGLLGGLWSLPQRSTAGELARDFGVRGLRRLGRVRHEYSHFTLELEVYRARAAGERMVRPGAVALDGATRKALALAGF